MVSDPRQPLERAGVPGAPRGELGLEAPRPSHPQGEPAYFWVQPLSIWNAGPAGLALILTFSPQDGKGGILIEKPRGKFGKCCVEWSKVYIYLGVQHLWPINVNLGIPTPHTHTFI